MHGTIVCIPEKSPCNPGGVSPSLYHAILCITGLLFTKRNRHYQCYCGMASEKPIGTGSIIPHRVEQPNPRLSTKVGRCLTGANLLSGMVLLKFISILSSFARSLFREPLNNSSMNCQRPKNKKSVFCFSHIISDFQSLIMAAHPCAAGKSELIQTFLRLISPCEDIMPAVPGSLSGANLP